MHSAKLILGWMFTVAGLILAFAAIGVAFWAFTFDNYDPVTQKWFDGFGRELIYNTPGPHGVEKSLGLVWGVIDTVAGITIFGICIGLLSLGRRFRSTGGETGHSGDDNEK